LPAIPPTPATFFEETAATLFALLAVSLVVSLVELLVELLVDEEELFAFWTCSAKELNRLENGAALLMGLCTLLVASFFVVPEYSSGKICMAFLLGP
jgi:hypothetical protein